MKVSQDRLSNLHANFFFFFDLIMIEVVGEAEDKRKKYLKLSPIEWWKTAETRKKREKTKVPRCLAGMFQ